MTDYQFKTLCCLAWLNLLFQADNMIMAIVAAAFVVAYAGGAIWAEYKESKK